MSEPTLTPVNYQNIYSNPYQVQGDRRLHGPEFDDLVESIRVSGIQQHPPARCHPTIPGAVQLISGHRRLAASRLARPDEPFYVVLKEKTDLQMLEDCASENLQRSDLNDIERAQMVEAYKTLKPDATNADMARVFKLKDPASITNIRKLLQLPAGIQKHVAENAIPDAIARQLVGVAKLSPKAAQKIADEVAAAPKSEKAKVFEAESQNLFWNKTESLDDAGWPLEWLADEPKEVETDLGDGDHFLGACGGCPFRLSDRCARKPCFDEKIKLWTALELQRVSGEKKIPVAGPDEKAQILFQGNYGDDDSAARLLNAKKEIRATLRLAPFEGHRHNTLSRLLGSHHVTLASVDVAVCREYVAERANGSNLKPVPVEKSADETDAQKAKRLAAEKAEQSANRATRSTMWKSYYDGLWLLDHASRIVGTELAKSHSGPFVTSIEHEFTEHHRARLGADPIDDRLEQELKRSGSEEEATRLRLTRVALHVFAQKAVKEYFKPSENEREIDFVRAHRVISEICVRRVADWNGHAFGVTLPAGWDVPPVHQTEFNCWHCGTFAGNTSEKLTQRDLKEDGWIDDGKQGVFCSQAHKTEYLAHSSNPAATKPKAAQANAKRASASKSKSKRK